MKSYHFILQKHLQIKTTRNTQNITKMPKRRKGQPDPSPADEKQIELNSAAEDSDEERVKELIEEGADVNFVTYFGQTALMFVATDRDEKCVEILTDAGADVNVIDKYGIVARSWLCNWKSVCVCAGAVQ